MKLRIFASFFTVFFTCFSHATTQSSDIDAKIEDVQQKASFYHQTTIVHPDQSEEVQYTEHYLYACQLYVFHATLTRKPDGRGMVNLFPTLKPPTIVDLLDQKLLFAQLLNPTQDMQFSIRQSQQFVADYPTRYLSTVHYPHLANAYQHCRAVSHEKEAYRKRAYQKLTQETHPTNNTKTSTHTHWQRDTNPEESRIVNWLTARALERFYTPTNQLAL